MAGYTARASIIINGVLRIAESGFTAGGCTTLHNAKRHVLRRLCNILRAHEHGCLDWVEWPKLSAAERKNWLDAVALTLRWDETNGRSHAQIHLSSVNEFDKILQKAVA